MRCAKPDVEKPLLRRSASLSGDIEDAARSLLPENTPALYPRVWTGDREASTEGVQLKFMQFNVLADGLSGEDPGKGGFGAVPPQSLVCVFVCVRACVCVCVCPRVFFLVCCVHTHWTTSAVTICTGLLIQRFPSLRVACSCCVCLRIGNFDG
jgi:hypothetical protein